MRILIAEINPYNITNPYISTLIDEMKQQDSNLNISWGRDLFWSDAANSFDIIHIMWPQFLIEQNTIDQFRTKLIELKKRNIKIVCTCHNLRPHYSSADDLTASYSVAYGLSDLIFHLGKYSFDLFKEQYPEVNQVLIDHHVYDQIYNKAYSLPDARMKLGLRQEGRYILCFGMFRSEEERNFIGSISKELNDGNIKIIAPSFFIVPRSKNLIKWFLSSLKYFKYKRRYPNIIMQTSFVKEKDLPYYFCAADLVLIQRLHILNSGNVAMAFFFGKPVLGANTGNVGPFLQDHENYVFEVQEAENIADKIRKILKNEEKMLMIGEKNKQIVISKLSTKITARKMIDSYKKILINAI